MKKLVIFALFVSTSAFAKGIGPAGCGLGNMLLGAEGNQIFAATTNGTSGSQTFGITSGTSNCVDKSGRASLDAFIEGNRMALETEAARGQGEALQGLAQVMKCVNAEEFGSVIKSNHSEIFSSGSSTQVGDKLKEVIKAHEVLCFNAG